jgi:heat shock protein HslJ/uncharacterized lipoprotein YbaY
MVHRTTLLALLAAAALCTGAQGSSLSPEGPEGTADPARIKGTVVYGETTVLPADAIVRVRLEIAAAPERPARLVAMIAVPTEGRQFPIPFEVPYKAADIQSEKRYFIRVSVTSGVQTIFASRMPYAVITKGAPTNIEVQLQPAGSGRRIRPQAVTATVGLAGQAWKLVALGDQPVAAAPDGSPTGITFDFGARRISGSTGCNRFMGTYEPGEGRVVKLDPAGTTRMACPGPAMQQETAFLDALRSTTAYRIVGATLELLAGDRVVARFESGGNAAARTE